MELNFEKVRSFMTKKKALTFKRQHFKMPSNTSKPYILQSTRHCIAALLSKFCISINLKTIRNVF